MSPWCLLAPSFQDLPTKFLRLSSKCTFAWLLPSGGHRGGLSEIPQLPHSGTHHSEQSRLRQSQESFLPCIPEDVALEKVQLGPWSV